MSDYRAIEEKIQGMLGSSRRPIAVTFLDAPPDGVAKFAGAMPSSCSFWRIAAAGSTFYTVASDHLNCPVGGYTHNTLPPDRMPELQQTLSSDERYRLHPYGGDPRRISSRDRTAGSALRASRRYARAAFRGASLWQGRAA
jgi:hypothetical protein